MRGVSTKTIEIVVCTNLCHDVIMLQVLNNKFRLEKFWLSLFVCLFGCFLLLLSLFIFQATLPHFLRNFRDNFRNFKKSVRKWKLLFHL